MASIFTYDPDPPRVASPWLAPTDSPKLSTPQPKEALPSSGVSPVTGNIADYGVTRLEAEPQEGPTEYKLHLLLRPRRNCRQPLFSACFLCQSLEMLLSYLFVSCAHEKPADH